MIRSVIPSVSEESGWSLHLVGSRPPDPSLRLGMTQRRAVFTAALLIAGVICASDGMWIWAKARLAQFLLHRAWQQTLAGGKQVKPWPWADTSPVARLRIRESDSIVLAGASGRTLAFGPAHLDGTAMPGSSGNCVVSAHRDTQFAVLRDIRPGEPIEITGADGRVHTYRVRETRIVDQHETWVLDTGVRGELTLITCYPFDAIVPGGPLRYVIFSDLV